jgi:hypothetical protein
MLETKSFEFRHEGRYTAFLATKLNYDDPNDHEVIRIARMIEKPPLIILIDLKARRMETNPLLWYNTAWANFHRYIVTNFDKLTTGGIIDYEAIHGSNT